MKHVYERALTMMRQQVNPHFIADYLHACLPAGQEATR